jgi:hypothetical protein
MPADRILARTGGNLTEYVPATAGGGGDANKVAALDGTGRFALGMMPIDVVDEVESMVASEALAAGAWINVFDAGAGVFKVRNADGNASKPVHGFVRAAILSGATGNVFFEGINDAVTGVTPGDLYLSVSVPGGFQAAVPTVAGQLVQRVGIGLSATEIKFQPRAPITLA